MKARHMYIDKQTVVKWQVNASIRNILAGECPVATHVIVQSAREIMYEYAKAKNIELIHDLSNLVKPEHVKTVRAVFKEHYNFFKHADKDADDEIDITNIHVVNEAETMLNIGKFNQLFKIPSQHMMVFNMYMMMRKPDLFDIDQMPFPNFAMAMLKDLIAEHQGRSRSELCPLFYDVLGVIAASEIADVKAMSLEEELKSKNTGHRDISKAPYFRRKPPQGG